MLDSETILKIVKAMLPPHVKVEIYAKDMPLIVKSDGDGDGGGGSSAGPVIPYEWVDLPAGYIEKLLNITNNEDILESNTRKYFDYWYERDAQGNLAALWIKILPNTFDSTVLLIKPGELRSSGSMESVFDIHSGFNNPEEWIISGGATFTGGIAKLDQQNEAIILRQELERPAEQGLIGTLRFKLDQIVSDYEPPYDVSILPALSSSDSPLTDEYCTLIAPIYGALAQRPGRTPTYGDNYDPGDNEIWWCTEYILGESTLNEWGLPINDIPVGIWLNEHFYLSKAMNLCDRPTTTYNASFLDPNTRTYKDIYAYPLYGLKYPLKYVSFFSASGDKVSFDYLGLAYADIYIDEYAILNNSLLLVGVPDNTQTTMIRIVGNGLTLMDGREPIFKPFQYDNKYISSRIFSPIVNESNIIMV